MTPEIPITRPRSQLQDDNDNDAYSLQQNSEAISVEVVGSDAASITDTRSIDDIEGTVMELLGDIAIDSAAIAIEKTVYCRLLQFVAAWGCSVIQEVLDSAIAPTIDTDVNSNDDSVLNNSRVLLGRNDLPLENLDPPKSCSLDYSYQRGQLPTKEPQQSYYDTEGLDVKAATRSHPRPSSIASSRMTMRSKVRKKQDDTKVVELSGPQPGVPYSTEVPQLRSARNRIVSPRKASNMSQAEQDLTINSNAAELQLTIDTESPGQENGEPSRRSLSPSSITSSRRRPHPPGSAQNGKSTKTLLFGEKEDEVQVEYAVLKTSPRRVSSSSKSILPNIENGRTKSRSNAPFPAFGVANEKESFNVEEPLDQLFHAMPLSPGVKVRVGEKANDGPDLPHFASRMQRSTFVRMETSTLQSQVSDLVASRSSSPINQLKVQELGRGTFLTETAWESSPTERSSARDHDRFNCDKADSGSKSDCVSSTELTTSCSCDSSSSLTLFRKSTKVHRPCRSCNKSNAESNGADTINYTDLIKQRAFHVKPTCLPSSPAKRVPGVSPRRVMSAPATSPLARRNLLLTKKISQ
ncbi:hypothetical protein F442_03646 [Phytophthora nicotianae P10297]|uniref:Uncharacterized protein n=4 Tax=Phytophthora nicotianae TaxID=4792 RepID=V9FPF5_PHYNI|nr:hypothetical protein F443_03672 [Phytophthora nicotianae P1569]ETK93191.1 hypothetical protein L915_03563 [Phytophthora nicotianae]ETO82029.1 hypothetical protein F444_03733 [Phytophthora nicotianae P1976]ETP51144.1 hypothetical protein F442_03646 [Phytophthora nicotianae P10297]ETL99752.1 hypothetical protein L917_03424 [Phytophthora nicotianae]